MNFLRKLSKGSQIRIQSELIQILNIIRIQNIIRNPNSTEPIRKQSYPKYSSDRIGLESDEFFPNPNYLNPILPVPILYSVWFHKLAEVIKRVNLTV